MARQLKIVRVNDKMQRGYRYVLTAPIGRNFDPEFRPELTPKEMLALGVFCGKYMTDCRKEFPASWFAHARLSPSGRNCSLNYFGVDASQPLSVWRDKGWIHPNDPRGWFQWYCRYYMGRRTPEEDARQIKRWKAIRRHVAQIKKHCEPGDQASASGFTALGLRQPHNLNTPCPGRPSQEALDAITNVRRLVAQVP
jgi:hypothetical protein